MEKEQCKGCGEDHYIVNRTKMLCDDCNYLRLHGETRFERESRKNLQYQEKSNKKQIERQKNQPPKIYKIKQSTKKNAKKDDLVAKAKLRVTMKALEEDMYYCWGCGEGSTGLDKSHIVSEKHRKDLAAEDENLNLFCRDCHMDWESGDITKMVQLHTFEKDMYYLKENDQIRFGIIVGKMEEYIRKMEGITNIQQLPVFKKIKNILQKIC